MTVDKVLVVDDDDSFRASLSQALVGAGFSVESAESGGRAKEFLARRGPVDAAVVDYRLPDTCGLDLIAEIRVLAPKVRTVLMTAFSSIPMAVRAIKAGATDYVVKPLDVVEFASALRVAAPPEADPLPLAEIPPDSASPRRALTVCAPSPLIGNSTPVLELRALIDRISHSPVSTVLLTGESGTGKDVVARTIHNSSSRSRFGFVNITCSALPESLLESELFGHEAGSFTSAGRQKRGLLELADRGTVFLDEVAEMTPQLQAKLLRFLEERAFRRVGGTSDVRVDVCVIAATNRDLPREVAAGRFREDLFYRLQVVPVHLPPLRERKGDIEALARHFIHLFNGMFGKNVERLSSGAMAQLLAHDWPGNVRELKHAIERSVLLADGPEIKSVDCAKSSHQSSEHAIHLPPEGLALAEVERSLLLQALAATGWNQVRAGRLLGLNRDQVRYRIEKFNLGSRRLDDGRAA